MKPYWQVGLHCTLLRMGIVPPARNLAVSPETAVTVGSASVWATPCRSKACKVALRFPLPLNQFRVASEAVAATEPLIAPLIANGGWGVKVPFGPVPLKSAPSALTMSRRISAIVTRRLTWSAPRIVRALTTFPWGLLGDLPPGAPPPLEPLEMEISGPVPDEVGESLMKPEAMWRAFCA